MSSTIAFVGENKSGEEYVTDIHGTGTLFGVGGERYIITAQHVAKYLREHGDSIGIPLSRTKNSDVWTLRGCEMHLCPDPFDIGIVHLKDRQLLEAMDDDWKFLGVEDISSVPPEAEFFYLMGYPAEMSEQTFGDHLVPGVLSLGLTRYDGQKSKVADPYNPEIHLLLNHSNELLEEGDPVRTPELGGISGCSIWLLKREEGDSDIWTANKDVKVVAVQFGYWENYYIKSTKWKAVAKAFESIDTGASRRIESALV